MVSLLELNAQRLACVASGANRSASASKTNIVASFGQELQKISRKGSRFIFFESLFGIILLFFENPLSRHCCSMVCVCVCVFVCVCVWMMTGVVFFSQKESESLTHYCGAHAAGRFWYESVCTGGNGRAASSAEVTPRLAYEPWQQQKTRR